jgi:putative colanic acid biosysnthesis UDP-glucose lipid carrier transferase
MFDGEIVRADVVKRIERSHHGVLLYREWARHEEAAVATSRAKRAFDVVVALALLVSFAPILVLLVVAIRLDTPGPVIFKQRRTGLHGRVFTIFKLRTMRVAEDDHVIRHARELDDRVTRLGRLLRMLSLDELPQLLNVLRGEMSIVGPRPHALAHDVYYGESLPTYAGRFRARPGLTGLAQVTGLRGEIRTLNGMAERVAADNAYIDTWSFRRDLDIAVKTAVVLLGRDPQAY